MSGEILLGGEGDRGIHSCDIAIAFPKVPTYVHATVTEYYIYWLTHWTIDTFCFVNFKVGCLALEFIIIM